MLSAKDLIPIIFPLDDLGSDFLNSVIEYYTVFLYKYNKHGSSIFPRNFKTKVFFTLLARRQISC